MTKRASKAVKRCWVCGRTEVEVSDSISGKTGREVELEKEIASVKASRKDYAKSFDSWAESGDLKMFAPFQALNKAQSEMGMSSVHFGAVTLGRGDKYLSDQLNEFSRVTGIKLYWDANDIRFYENPVAQIDYKLNGRKPEERAKISKMAADLFYHVQLNVLSDQLREESQKRATWGIRMMKLKDSQSEVPICDVCSALISTVRPPRQKDEGDWDDDGGGYSGGDEGYAEDFAEPDARD